MAYTGKSKKNSNYMPESPIKMYQMDYMSLNYWIEVV